MFSDNLQGYSFVILIQWCTPLIVEQLDPDDILNSMATISSDSKYLSCADFGILLFVTVLQ